MNIKEHYPQRTLTLRPGDTIWATYKRPKGSQISAKTLKCLYGWISDQRYIGCVRRDASLREESPEGRLVVDLYRSDERGKCQCTHFVYNIEMQIAKGELTDLRYKPNPNPLLFDDEC